MLNLSSQSVLRRRFLLLAWAFIAVIPIAYIAAQVIASSRNIVFWDEFDTALDLILRINAGADWHELLRRFFAMNNEHRTVTSRLMFAASYWLTGTVNFHVIGAIGNLFLVGACATLVAAVSGWERRVRLGVVLAFLIFQLENFENFIWSGASIDHFQVVMLGIASLAALTRGSWGMWAVAVAFGLLATFTLAHGNVVWPVGIALLVYQRRWNHLTGWCACATVALAGFLHGFEFNPGHHISALTFGSLGHVTRYWLALLGAPLTLGDAALAPLPGLGLLAGLGILAARGAATREPVAMSCAVFAIGALALVAFGRVQLAGAEVNSRYMVLGALAWALFIYMLLELEAQPDRPFRMLACLVPALAAFNVSANVKFAPMVDSFVEVRDRAATSFKQFGEDGRGITRLHPQARHADVLLKMAEERGVYRLPQFSNVAEFADATPNSHIITYVDELIVNDRAVTIGGWAMLPGKLSKRGQVYVVLRSAKSLLYFSTVTLQRPDVAKAYNEPKWRLAGFRAVIGRQRLPAEDFEVGVLIAEDEDSGEFLMTQNRLLLSTHEEAKVVRLTGTP
jgi:hypothetical protein